MEKLRDEIVAWIKDWFERNGKGCKAVIGISGGKDSSVAAALCARALGPENVIGVSMPDSQQGTNNAKEICEALGIEYILAPIGGIIYGFSFLEDVMFKKTAEDKVKNLIFSGQAKQNIPPRVRMTMLYAISQANNGRVCGTCNLSENWIGYATRWGDSVSDFEPLANLTCSEVIELGLTMPELKEEWIRRKPDDGLPGSMPDEEKFGFTYAVLDKYIRTGECSDEKIKEKIDKMHKDNAFKMKMPECFENKKED